MGAAVDMAGSFTSPFPPSGGSIWTCFACLYVGTFVLAAKMVQGEGDIAMSSLVLSIFFCLSSDKSIVKDCIVPLIQE